MKYNEYLTKEKCQELALKCNTIKEFRKLNESAYRKSIKFGWLEDISSHMIKYKKPSNYWTKEKLQNEANKYKNKGEFQKYSETAYIIARRTKCIDDICSHMDSIGNYIKRCIYVYEFSDNSAYIGLTYSFENRHYRHLKESKSPVYKKIIIHNIPFIHKKLTDYIDVDNAKELENYYVTEYKNKNWTILNKAKTGGIGIAKVIWTKEKCLQEALKYNNKKDFYKKSYNAYYKAKKKKWIDEICSHMIDYSWTKEKCLQEALKYNNKKDFYTKSNYAYKKSCQKNWLKEICSHMD
jgi:hypothetical protein